MIHVKVAPEYGCYPIWIYETIESVPDNVSADSLPISPDLAGRLGKWDVSFQATLDGSYPPDSGFSSIRAYQEYLELGRHIVNELEAELGKAYSVEYQYVKF